MGPSRKRALAALLELYPSHSVSRRFLLLVNALNTLAFRLPPRDLKFVSDRDGLLRPLDGTVSRAYLLHKLAFSERAYIYDRDASGQTVAVTKMAISDKAAEGLMAEERVLAELSQQDHPFRVPKILDFVQAKAVCVLRTEAIPPGFTHHPKGAPIPESLFESISALRPIDKPTTVLAREIEGWEEALRQTSTQCLRAEGEKVSPQDLFEVGAAHRDLGSDNLFSKRPAQRLSDFYLIDWEFFTYSAPAQTDLVGVWLGNHHRALKGRGRPDVERLARQFLAHFDTTPERRVSAVIALLHLADQGIDLARILCGMPR